MRVRLTRIGSSSMKSSHRESLGICQEAPEMGECFVMTAGKKGSLPPRLIRTAPIIRIRRKGNVITLETRINSYKLELLEPDDVLV